MRGSKDIKWSIFKVICNNSRERDDDICREYWQPTGAGCHGSGGGCLGSSPSSVISEQYADLKQVKSLSEPQFP